MKLDGGTMMRKNTMKKTTNAIVIINKSGDILGCHGYKKPIEGGYDFPKGINEENEGDRDAAIRELKEEAGIILQFPERLVDCGIHKHNSEKNIHIFLYQTENFPDLSKLTCVSFFTDSGGNTCPKIDGYRIIKKEDRERYFYKVLHNKFSIIDEKNT